jgi:Na+/melibiose symporter-like transporter
MDPSSAAQSRPAAHRTGKLKPSLKIGYGTGAIASNIQGVGFTTFLFFYYNGVLGLSGSLTGVATAGALVLDAFLDPIAGSLSDGWRSRWGRRHPFMVVGAIPMAVAFYLLFVPPASLHGWNLGAWLMSFAIVCRGFMSVYSIPHSALGAELSNDYEERTSIVTYRLAVGGAGAAAFAVSAYPLFFPDSKAFPKGQMNPAGYPHFALVGAILIVTTILYSAWSTRATIPTLPQAPPNPERFAFGRVLREFRQVSRNPSFIPLFGSGLIYYVYSGVTSTLNTHMNTYFWEFNSSQLQWMALPLIFGVILGAPWTTPLHRRFDKRATMVGSSLIAAVIGGSGVVLRVVGWFPKNGSPMLLPVIWAILLMVACVGVISLITASSMMADVAQDHAYRSGKNQEGVLFSALAFGDKAASGMGSLIAGFAIDLIHFPAQAVPGKIDPEIVRNLGLVVVSLSALPMLSALALMSYRITRETNAIALDALANGQTAQSAQQS